MDRETILKYMKDRKQQCALEILEIATGNRQVLARFEKVIEAPNWTRDGKKLIYNSEGLIYEFDFKTMKSEVIHTDFANLCNNDHVLSPDGKFLAISHFTAEDMKSRIYIVPLEGGTPVCVTKEGPSYLHGWSPEGKHLAYCAEREGNYDIYTITVQGENEKRLTFTPGLDDGPEYDPKGEKIWFNSTRSGLMQLWCMNKDGSEQTQMSNIEMNCWFPHVSPDGSQVAYIAYYVGDLKPEEHLPDKQVQIRLMDISGHKDRVLAEFNGGQGTMNVNSWSPDGKYLAFVSY
jgi:Tol biopolymer transport system component